MSAALHRAFCCIAVGALVLLGATGLGSVAGCKRAGTTPLGAPPVVKAGPDVALPDGGMSHTEPLAELRWAGSWVMACGGRRVEGTAGRAGGSTRGACRAAMGALAVAGASTSTSTSTSTRDGGDGRPSDEAFRAGSEGTIAAPCRVYYEDIPGDPGAPPARASLIGPSGTLLLDEWRVPREVDGDYFAIEVRPSPDGRWIALVHVSVGIGEGERLVRVESVWVRPMPVCSP